MLKNKFLVGAMFVAVLGVASFVFADTVSPPATVACVKSSVITRETALGLAVGDYTRSVGIAYSDRALALQNAYSKTGNNVIKASVKSAWSNFNTFIKSVKNKWSMAKTSAWSTYRSAVKACKASSTIVDSSSSGSEI